MTAVFSDVPDPLATIGRLLAITASLWIALSPGRSILEDTLLVLGGESAIPLVTSPVVGIVVLLVPAGLLARVFARHTERFVLFAILTVLIHPVVRWVSGLSSEPLELATHVIVAETLVYITAIALAASITVHPDVDPRVLGERESDDTSETG